MLRHVIYPALALFSSALATGAYSSEADAEFEAKQAQDVLMVRNAMLQIAQSPDTSLADKLLMPTLVSHDEILAALSFQSAWREDGAKRRLNDEGKTAFADLAFYGGGLYFLEWSCSTGREDGVAHQFVDLITREVTTYPERLLLAYFIVERRARGFDKWKSCDREMLQIYRDKNQDAVSLVLAM